MHTGIQSIFQAVRLLRNEAIVPNGNQAAVGASVRWTHQAIDLFANIR